MTTRRTYVLDTSVLLSDPGALLRFGDSDVVLPLVVIGELEDKRNHPELGWFARQALRILDDLRVTHGRLDAPVPSATTGGTLHVELNHSDPSVLPAGFRNDTNDSRIMVGGARTCGRGPRRLPDHQGRAAAGQGGRRRLDTDEYRLHDAVDDRWTGMAELGAGRRRARRALRRRRGRSCPTAAELPPHTGLVLLSSAGSALGPGDPDKTVRLVRGDREAFGLHGRSPSSGSRWTCCWTRVIGIVSLGGAAGTGKSALALCAGPGVGDGAARAQEGRHLPPAVRRRRPGAGLPARRREREDVALGAGGLRHARRGRPRER